MNSSTDTLDLDRSPLLTERAPASPSATHAAPTDRAAPPAAGRSRRPLVLGAVAAVALAGAGWWFAHRGIEDTDDAQLDGDVVNVPARTTAVVTEILFTDNQPVAKDAILARLDPKPAEARLAQAEAELLSAKAAAQAAHVEAALAASNARGQRTAAAASLRGARVTVSTTAQQIAEADAQLRAATATHDKARLDLERARALFAKEVVARAQLDAAQAAFDAAQATVAQARARAASLRASTEQVEARISEANARLQQASTVDQQIADAEARAQVADARVRTAQAARDLAALELSYTTIRAPRDGIVSRRTINVGQMVTPGTPIAAIVPTSGLWVTGNFKETQLAHMKPGQPATVHIDAYGVDLHGKVDSFSGATGARFSLLPPDNATGNYTKVVQRVPVRIALTDAPKDLALRPGLSVVLAVDTRR
jgi:membrane fusion protein (multidrug efflux system)